MLVSPFHSSHSHYSLHCLGLISSSNRQRWLHRSRERMVMTGEALPAKRSSLLDGRVKTLCGSIVSFLSLEDRYLMTECCRDWYYEPYHRLPSATGGHFTIDTALIDGTRPVARNHEQPATALTYAQPDRLTILASQDSVSMWRACEDMKLLARLTRMRRLDLKFDLDQGRDAGRNAILDTWLLWLLDPVRVNMSVGLTFAEGSRIFEGDTDRLFHLLLTRFQPLGHRLVSLEWQCYGYHDLPIISDVPRMRAYAFAPYLTTLSVPCSPITLGILALCLSLPLLENFTSGSIVDLERNQIEDNQVTRRDLAPFVTVVRPRFRPLSLGRGSAIPVVLNAILISCNHALTVLELHGPRALNAVSWWRSNVCRLVNLRVLRMKWMGLQNKDVLSLLRFGMVGILSPPSPSSSSPPLQPLTMRGDLASYRTGLLASHCVNSY